MVFLTVPEAWLDTKLLKKGIDFCLRRLYNGIGIWKRLWVAEQITLAPGTGLAARFLQGG